MRKLEWYSRRLAAMSVGEIAWRASGVVRAARDERRRLPTAAEIVADGATATAFDGFRAADGRPVLLDRARAATIADEYPDGLAAVLAAAERLVDGRVQFFGYPAARLVEPIDWSHDPVADVHWPRIASGRLNHRSAAGDAKWIWELNRLQHLPLLAQAYLFTGDERFAETAWHHLDGWLAQSPPGHGIAWRGAFEAGVRAISIAVALQGLRDSPATTRDRYEAVLVVLDESARRCWDDRSRYSSANNHLVGELAGLAVVSLLHPELTESGPRLARALRHLAHEARAQILPDGAGAEQAFAYQLFTGDLLLVVAALLRAADRPVPEGMTAGLDRSARYLAALVGDDDPVPRYGDDDEGFALRLDDAPVPDVRTHLAAVGAVTGDPTAAARGRAGVTSAWLGGSEPATPHGEPEPLGAGRHAADGGLVVLRGDGGRVLTMDVGPLGYLSIAAHGHADALALTLAVDGREIVSDPGAGSYYGHPDRRRVHRSTRAHATVEVAGADQSTTGGPFLWTDRAQVRVRRVDVAGGVVDAEHDGYTRLADPVVHRRRVVAAPGSPAVLVVDVLTGAAADTRIEARTTWPLHPDLDVICGPAGHLVHAAGTLVMDVVHAADVPFTREEVRGDEASGLGWWADRLESRLPACWIGAAVRGTGRVVVATAFVPPGTLESRPGDPLDGPLLVTVDEDTILVTLRAGDASIVERIAL
ncbi:alginate lyase family protein [Pseudonocardia sp. N23]|uniref:heparinase II/III family protein n=1 Tax=Pseudonocardia sp. N23 TaxID=1987376 RepID=UPI000C02E156|nr:alginate lyase family protein [Pseudonocardia sp. N23]GAY12245.1 hypothetical protein TOK_0637 [Pseudonocardia sp. N23]